MDKINEKIVRNLVAKPKIPISQLAKKCRISQQVASYRLKKLEKENNLTARAIINLTKLGYEQYRIFFKFKKAEYREDLLEYLKTHKKVSWVATIGGSYDFFCIILVKNYMGFIDFISELNEKFPGAIKGYDVLQILHQYFFPYKFLGKETNKNYNFSSVEEPIKISDLDKKILNAIKPNARISALNTAEKLKVSYKTIINKIKKFEKNKIILGYRVFMHSELKRFIILAPYTNYSKKDEDSLIDYLGRHKNVTQLTTQLGKFPLMFQIRAKDNEHLQNMLIGIRDKFEIIDNLEIVPIFKNIISNKIEY